MKFKAILTTSDGRITGGKTYVGSFVMKEKSIKPFAAPPGLRVVVFDNRKEWMTFDPDALIPADSPADA